MLQHCRFKSWASFPGQAGFSHRHYCFRYLFRSSGYQLSGKPLISLYFYYYSFTCTLS
uniref:Uncharacterized protein n=1 Tax=uncultured Desulfobacterium sp. TaxID=201089 RepID=E1YKV8_9BACT|nr:unknown protein [uncultured Desulfobacterium sp.]